MNGDAVDVLDRISALIAECIDGQAPKGSVEDCRVLTRCLQRIELEILAVRPLTPRPQ